MPPQEAPQSGQATTAPSPNLLPIPPYRVHLFTVGVGERLREGAARGESEAKTLEHITRERQALAASIETESFRTAFARAYEQAHNALQAEAPVSIEQARVATDDIVKNRANDARQLAHLITQPDFLDAARTAAPKPAQYILPPEKITEMVSRFTAEGSSYGIDARIHNQQAMAGHRIGHLALVKVFAENGPLHGALKQQLKVHLPQLDDAAISTLANDWLEARREPAAATAATLGEGGAVYQQVLQRSDATRVTATKAQAAALMSTTALTPQLSESQKTRQQKAEDVIYTLNHALTCLSITDLLVMPTVNGVLGTMFGDNAPKFGCAGHGHGHHDHGHDHGHGHGHDHHDHAHHDHGGHGHAHHDHGHKRSPWDELKAPFRNMRNWFKSDAPWSEKFKSIGSNTRNWLVSEAVGDVGAVVPTIALQRFAPGFMESIRRTVEPVVGGFFRRGSEKAARQWADKNGIDRDSQECVDRAKQLYEYEVRHLPQMAIWTLSSIGISWASMKMLSPSMGLPEFARTKIVGAGVTAGLVVGARAFSPNAAHGWDQSISKHLIVPTTKILGKPFGVENEDVDKFMRRQEENDGPKLQGRVAQAPVQLAQTA